MIGKTFILSTNPVDINEIINDPDVLPFVLAAGSNAKELDATELFAKGAFSILTMNKDGGALLIPDNNEEVEAHTFAKKSARGDYMTTACKDGTRYILENMGYKRVYGFTPKDNKIAIAFNERIGFSLVGEVKKDRGGGIMESLLKYEMVI